MDIRGRISIDSAICSGQACVKGTRIPVYQLVRMLANGDTIDDLLEEYPSLTREDILACLDYSASLAEEQVTPIERLSDLDDDGLMVEVIREALDDYLNGTADLVPHEEVMTRLEAKLKK